LSLRGRPRLVKVTKTHKVQTQNVPSLTNESLNLVETLSNYMYLQRANS